MPETASAPTAHPPCWLRPPPADRIQVGCISSRLKLPVFGSVSSSLWMVHTSTPVHSLSRLAARPVRAHSATATRLARSTIRIEFISVVLLTPRPTCNHQHFAADRQIESLLQAVHQGQASLPSIHGMALPVSITPSRAADRAPDRPRFGNGLFSAVECSQEQAVASFDLSAITAPVSRSGL